MTITRDPDVLGGDPRVDGTRVGVLQVYELAVTGGYAPEDVADQLGISLGEVHAALAWYYDHPDEVRAVRERHREVERELAENAVEPPSTAE
ncbi:MAG: DUF433 domain-containing protein [Halalkalicoccus sp.]